MLLNELKQITEKDRQRKFQADYIKNHLKEYLQVYVLNYIYTSKKYTDRLIFTGGTCLRHVYGLNRLSEDIDLDCLDDVNTRSIQNELFDYFGKRYLYKGLYITRHQNGKQLRLKFPVLKELKLAKDSESDLLFVKVDFSDLESINYKVLTTLKSLYGFNYLVTHYDLPTLMAGKISAIFQRQRLVGKQNREIIKGRDYFDLLWYLQKGVVPNLKVVRDKLNEEIFMDDLIRRLNQKVDLATSKYPSDFKKDIIPFIENPDIVDKYVEKYKENYLESVKYLTGKK